MKIKDIIGKEIKVTNLQKSIRQCRHCLDSPYIMDSGYTVGENYAFMLKQLEKIKNKPTD